ncbi:MAG: glycogen synthase [Spirochaetes bacterium]|nr:glycogen synthase [Spirochaetota bacterium]
MKIAFISSEVYPYAKTGGLADVSYSITKALAKAGHDVCIFMPGYHSIDKNKFHVKLAIAPLIIEAGTEKNYAAILESSYIPGVKTYFINYERYFTRDGLYGECDTEYKDNAERFNFFAKAVIRSFKKINFMPDIIHCNDWHTGLIPLYLKTIYNNDTFFKKSALIMTVHNAGYQGIFSKDNLQPDAFYNSAFGRKETEHSEVINFLKEGVIHSDIITTVSKKYANEIQTQEFGYAMADIFKRIKKNLYAVPNAIDNDNWDPETDHYLTYNFSADDISQKMKCKLELQKKIGIAANESIPLLGTISRITFQKGMDILADTLELLFQDENFQFVISGSGDKRITRRYDYLKKMFPQSVGINWMYSEELEHLTLAGLDIFIMPSRYEPCGLTHMYSLKYGTVPIVRATGGLDDVIKEWNERKGTGNGFKFNNLNQEELYNILRKVIKKYKEKDKWKLIRKNGMNFNYSWNEAVKEYEKIYKLVLK